MRWMRQNAEGIDVASRLPRSLNVWAVRGHIGLVSDPSKHGPLGTSGAVRHHGVSGESFESCGFRGEASMKQTYSGTSHSTVVGQTGIWGMWKPCGRLEVVNKFLGRCWWVFAALHRTDDTTAPANTAAVLCASLNVAQNLEDFSFFLT